MKTEIKYIELKTGYSDNGPAWIGKVKLSKSGQTIYFNDKAFKKGLSTYGNYFDIEAGEDYWISGIKKDGADRHWAGSGKITIDKNIIDKYLEITGFSSIDENIYTIVDIKENYPIERINKLENEKFND